MLKALLSHSALSSSSEIGSARFGVVPIPAANCSFLLISRAYRTAPFSSYPEHIELLLSPHIQSISNCSFLLISRAYRTAPFSSYPEHIELLLSPHIQSISNCSFLLISRAYQHVLKCGSSFFKSHTSLCKSSRRYLCIPAAMDAKLPVIVYNKNYLNMWGFRASVHVHIKPPMLQNQHAISEQIHTIGGLFKAGFTMEYIDRH